VDNIGLNVEGQGILFDFGLARTLPRGTKKTSVFVMSGGDIGNERYMAPEICKSKPYNAKADVYSFSRVFREILESSSAAEQWPIGIQRLLEQSSHSDMTKRPTMKEARRILGQEITKLQKRQKPTRMLHRSWARRQRRQQQQVLEQ